MQAIAANIMCTRGQHQNYVKVNNHRTAFTRAVSRMQKMTGKANHSIDGELYRNITRPEGPTSMEGYISFFHDKLGLFTHPQTLEEYPPIPGVLINPQVANKVPKDLKDLRKRLRVTYAPINGE